MRPVEALKPGRALAFALGLGLAGGLGCGAKMINYRDLEGPRFDGRQGAAPASPPRVLRVVTFNIEHSLRTDRALTALRTHPDLRFSDVLALQEMDAPGVAALAQGLQYNYVYFPASRDPETGKDFGNAVLSPWPIEDGWKIPLPHLSRGKGRARAATGARLRLGGSSLVVYSVHLGAPLGTTGGEREDQAKAVLADAASRPGPVILAGDFNSHALGRFIAARGFSWVTETVGGSARQGPLRFGFDHVFLRGLRPAPSPAAAVARDVADASDHFPVWALVAPE
jgi:endonuclease/exonuclease/phosphatase family metal-dependent hydrolase